MKKYAFLISIFAFAISALSQRIVLLSDIHVSPNNDNSRMLKEAVAEINSLDCDIVVVDGDLTNEGSDIELAYVKSILDGIRHPLYAVPGNHENNWSQSATKTFVDLWGNDRFCTTIGNMIVVGINCGPYMKMGDGHVKQEDLHWLRATLDSLCAPGMKFLSFNHYPLKPDDLDNCNAYASLLAEYPTILHVNGHYHKWDQYAYGDIPALTTRALFVDGTFGYCILDFENDNIVVSEKLIGEAPTVKYIIPQNPSHAAIQPLQAGLPCAPEGVELTLVWEDSASIFTRLAFDAEKVYFGTSAGLAKAVNKNTGSLAWQLPLGASLFSRPTVLADDNIAFPNAYGVTITRTSDGAIMAHQPSKEGPYVADGIIANNIYLQGAYKRFEARNACDGSLIWSYDSINNYCQGAPAVDGDDIVFGAWDTNLRCISLADGSLKWIWNNGKKNNLFSPGNVVPMITADKVIIVAPDRYMTAIDRKTGQTIWRDNSHKYRESMGHSEDGKRVYAKTMDGELVAIDATSDTFRELWICDMGIGYEHAPCIVAEKDGVVYAGSRHGVLTAVSADTHDILWQLQLGSSEINGIDIDPTDNSIWVSLIEGRVFRL